MSKIVIPACKDIDFLRGLTTAAHVTHVNIVYRGDTNAFLFILIWKCMFVFIAL